VSLFSFSRRQDTHMLHYPLSTPFCVNSVQILNGISFLNINTKITFLLIDYFWLNIFVSPTVVRSRTFPLSSLFLSLKQTFISSFCENLWVVNSLDHCLSENLFTLTSLKNGRLAGCKILSCPCFNKHSEVPL
jgi:hypothetical protein